MVDKEVARILARLESLGINWESHSRDFGRGVCSNGYRCEVKRNVTAQHNWSYVCVWAPDDTSIVNTSTQELDPESKAYLADCILRQLEQAKENAKKAAENRVTEDRRKFWE